MRGVDAADQRFVRFFGRSFQLNDLETEENKYFPRLFFTDLGHFFNIDSRDLSRVRHFVSIPVGRLTEYAAIKYAALARFFGSNVV